MLDYNLSTDFYFVNVELLNVDDRQVNKWIPSYLYEFFIFWLVIEVPTNHSLPGVAYRLEHNQEWAFVLNSFT